MKSSVLLSALFTGLLVFGAGVASGADYPADVGQAIAAREPWPAEVRVPRLDAVTKESYAGTADVFFQAVRRNMEYWLRQPKPYPNMTVYTDSARWLAFQYSLSRWEVDLSGL